MKNQVITRQRAEYSTRQLKIISSNQARRKMSYEIACKYRVLALSYDQADQELLILGQLNHEELKDLQFLLNCRIRQEETDSCLKEAIYQLYKSDPQELIKIKQEIKASPKTAGPLSGSNPESKFLHSLIEYAIANQASDIHIVPTIEGTIIKIRINGELYKHESIICNLDQHQVLINRIKILAELDITKRKLPQDGSFLFSQEIMQKKIRVSSLPVLYGEKIVLRILDNQIKYFLSDLNLNTKVLSHLQTTLRNKEGLILFSGTTGSGKTTSLYASINEIAQENLSIATIEDPVEVNLAGIEQSSVSLPTGFTYPKAIRSLMRQDPDIIVIGEIRDAESCRIAFHAASSGHLVLSTVHAGNIEQTWQRINNFGIDTFEAKRILKLIIHQNLVPILCQQCKMKKQHWRNNSKTTRYQIKGCKLCQQSGYQGRQVLASYYSQSEKFSINRTEEFRINDYSEHLAELLKLGEIDLKTYQKYSDSEYQ